MSALALVLWVLLVLVAVHRGQDARNGGGLGDWVLTVVVSLIAAGVLLGVFVALPHARAAWQAGRPPAVAGRRRRA